MMRLSQGLKIINVDHPEWGSFYVIDQAKGVPGMWEIRGRSGYRLLDEGELHFWTLADCPE
jgi:hypothetical protein